MTAVVGAPRVWLRLEGLAVLALAVLLGGGYFAYDKGVSALRERFEPAPDYKGTGSGSVLIEGVPSGPGVGTTTTSTCSGRTTHPCSRGAVATPR